MAQAASTNPTDVVYHAARGAKVMVIAERLAARRDLMAIVAAHDGCLVASAGSRDADACIARLTGGYVVIADLRDVAADAADAVMRVLAGSQGRSTIPVATLAIIDEAAIDHAWARMATPWITLLVAPDDGDMHHAVAELLTPAAPGLSDSGREDHSRQLAVLSEEVGRIARALAALSGEQAAAGTNLPDDEQSDPAMLLATARTLLRLRRLRGQYLTPALFADPAWDMLLDLFAARMERRRVAVSSLCIAAAVPPTTALRWIATMTEQGLFVRRPDPEDGRRVFIALSDTTASAMTCYLAAARRLVAHSG